MKSKITRLILALVATAALLPFLFFKPADERPAQKAGQYYRLQCSLLLQALISLNRQLAIKAPAPIIRQSFAEARAIYKRTELFTEYYFPLQARLINGPPQPLLEADNTDIAIEPHGFQVLEENIYSQKINYLRALMEARHLVNTVKALHGKASVLQMNDAGLFYALRQQMIRITALGICGFDSQVAQQSLAEAAASLEGIGAVLIYFDRNKSNGVFKVLQQATAYLGTHRDFNGFNRAYFIKEILNPVTLAILAMQQRLQIALPGGIRPLRNDARHLFESNVFNMNFFDGNNDEDLALTEAKVALGEKLFFDAALSSGGVRSCSSCHQPAKAFTDGLAKSIALDGHNTVGRNAPTLWNAALQSAQFWDNRVATLEEQIEKVITNRKEMDGNLPCFADRLLADSVYRNLWVNAFGSVKREQAEKNIINAIASYVRSLIALNARADKYLRGETNDFTTREINGFNLFTGKAKCATCHFLPLYNGQVPPLYDRQETEAIGVPENGDGKRIDPDKGRYYKYPLPLLEFHFKVPTLRNIALTAPYMHNGVFNTLDEVINFYDKGGGQGLGLPLPNQTLPAAKLHLTAREKEDLKFFLQTLTDTARNN